MPRHDRRGLVPEAWVEPYRPRDPTLRRRWEELGADERRRIVRASVEPAAAARTRHPELVRTVAARRVERHPWTLAAAAVVGWLVLMTVWGIGRSGFPAQEGWFLAAGLGVALAATATIAAGAVRRRRRAREVLERLGRPSRP